MEGQVSLPDLAADMLLTRTVFEKSQNQNAGFSGWFVLAVVFRNSLQFGRVLVKGHREYALTLQTIRSRFKLGIELCAARLLLTVRLLLARHVQTCCSSSGTCLDLFKPKPSCLLTVTGTHIRNRVQHDSL